MPDIHASFTNREVLEALRKAGWGHLLPSDNDLENPDEVCVEFTTSTDDADEDEDEDDDDEDDFCEDDEGESCEQGADDDEDEESAVEPEKFQQVWDSLDD